MNLADRIIVALDVQGRQEVEAALAKLTNVTFVKVGMELFYSTGPDLIKSLKDRGLKVFLDLKVHDIPNTAYGSINSLSKLGCDILNLHCAGGLTMMEQARAALVGETKLIGVTQLTSTDQNTLNNQLLISGSVEDCVLHYAKLAQQAGLHGVVCSPNEVEQVKSVCGSEFLTVTPGVRPKWAETGDQKRVMTPGEAMKVGSDYLVIGRPIMASDHPEKAFNDILSEMEEAL